MKTTAGQIDSNSTFLVIFEVAEEDERVSIESCRGQCDSIRSDRRLEASPERGCLAEKVEEGKR